jgi:hypothetical protein
MWQLCGWGRVDISMTFHKRAFDFFTHNCIRKVGLHLSYHERNFNFTSGGRLRNFTGPAGCKPKQKARKWEICLQRQPTNLNFLIIFFLNLKFVINIDGELCVKRCTYLSRKTFTPLDE